MTTMNSGLRTLVSVAALAALPLALACRHDATAPTGVADGASLTGMTIEPGNLTLEVGQVTQLKAVMAGPDGSPLSGNVKILWTSSNPDIVSITSAGVLAVHGVGTVTITAECAIHRVFTTAEAVPSGTIDPPTGPAMSGSRIL